MILNNVYCLIIDVSTTKTESYFQNMICLKFNLKMTVQYLKKAIEKIEK